MSTLRLDPTPSGRREGLLTTPDEAVRHIPKSSRVAVGGTGSLLQVPETLLAALERRWLAEKAPGDLDVVHVMGLGDYKGRGIDHIAIPGLVRRFVGSHFVLSPRQQGLLARGEVEAVGSATAASSSIPTLPSGSARNSGGIVVVEVKRTVARGAIPAGRVRTGQAAENALLHGTISLLYREIAARRPGLFTDIGLDTFVDPRHQWGRMNDRTRLGLSELVTVGGQEWLFYPRFDIDVALLRASEADPDGNVGMDDEAAVADNLAIAQAARNSGGIVVVEVKRTVARGAIPAGRVRIPGALVDHLVVTDFPNQTPTTIEDARRTGAAANRPTRVEALPFDHRKVVARRAATELSAGDLANLGVGMANGISYVALEEGFLDRFTLTVEQGILGGLPGVGLDSGTAVNPTAIIDMPSTFDLYDGGGLDFAGLAFAQIDRRGNVNVARVGDTPIGPGGFIDISQKARTIVFCGTLRGGGLDIRLDDGELRIVRDGRYPKFVEDVQYVSFNAERARALGQQVRYVTERAVFRLAERGVELIEIAPGVDLRRDVLDRMGFTPMMPTSPRLMDRRFFLPGPAGIRIRPPRDARHRDNQQRERSHTT